MFLVLVYIVYPGLGQRNIFIGREGKFCCITLAAVAHIARRTLSDLFFLV